jgi:hypothetical protein
METGVESSDADEMRLRQELDRMKAIVDKPSKPPKGAKKGLGLKKQILDGGWIWLTLAIKLLNLKLDINHSIPGPNPGIWEASPNYLMSHAPTWFINVSGGVLSSLLGEIVITTPGTDDVLHTFSTIVTAP